jgi:TolB-like protein
VRLVQLAGGGVLGAEVASLPGARSAVAPVAGPQAAVPAAAGGLAAPVDVAVRRLADQLAAGFQKQADARYKRVAVLGFSETGAESRRRELGTVVSAELATALRRDHGFLLVERARLKEVLGEMRLGAMGLVDEATAPRLGKLADAQALVLGSVSEAGDRFLVNARIVTAETAETVAASSQAVSAGSLVALSSEAVVLRSRSEALFRSMLLPGWGQFYNRQPVKGWLVAGGEVVLVGGAVAAQVLGQSAESKYRKATDTATADAQRRRSESSYGWRNGLLIGAAGLWALNVADAWLSGVDGDKLVTVEAIDRGAAVALALRF